MLRPSLWPVGEMVAWRRRKVDRHREKRSPMTEAEWLEGNDVRGMLRHLGGRLSERKLLLFAAHCCRRVWGRFADGRTRQVVECAERRAEGLASQEELFRAYEAAVEAWREAMAAAD